MVSDYGLAGPDAGAGCRSCANLWQQLRELTAERDQLRAAVAALLPEVQRAERCEASADDGYGQRLRALREAVNLARAALEGKPGA